MSREVLAATTRVCKVCHGRGVIIDLTCRACHGQGTYVDPVATEREQTQRLLHENDELRELLRTVWRSLARNYWADLDEAVEAIDDVLRLIQPLTS